MRRPRRFRTTAVLVGLVAIIASACSDSASSADRQSRSARSTTTTTAPAPQCGNAVASYAPSGPLPFPGAMPAGSTMAQIQQRGRLIAGVSADTLLFGFRNPFSGKLEGFDIDLVH